MKNNVAEYQLSQRVYYEDTDAGGVVYHANYLKFMERCRCEWLEDIGFGVVQLQEQHNIQFVVRSAQIDYLLPARLFDTLMVTCRVLQVGKVQLLLEQNIYNQSELACSASIKLATLDATSFKLAAMPKALHSVLKKSISA